MADCEKYIEMLSARADGELPPECEAALTEHLNSCSSCRRVRDAFGVVSELLGETAQPPEGFAGSVMAEICRREGAAGDRSGAERADGGKDTKAGPKKSANPRRRVWLRWAAVAACAALIILSGSKSLFGDVYKFENTSGGGDMARSAASQETAMDTADLEEAEIYGMGGEGVASNEAKAAPVPDPPAAQAPSGDTGDAGRSEEPMEAQSVDLGTSLDSLDISQMLETLFSGAAVSLYSGDWDPQTVLEDGAAAFFTFIDEQSSATVKSLLGTPVERLEKSVENTEEQQALVLVRLTGEAGDCCLEVRAGESLVCTLWTADGADTSFTVDGDPAVFTSFIEELKVLSVG